MTEAKNVNGSYIFDLRRMLLQSAAIGLKKLLVDDKITACAKEICLLGIVCNVSNIW